MTTPEYAMILVLQSKIGHLEEENEKLLKRYTKYESLKHAVKEMDHPFSITKCGICKLYMYKEYDWEEGNCETLECSFKTNVCKNCIESKAYKNVKCTMENCECIRKSVEGEHLSLAAGCYVCIE